MKLESVELYTSSLEKQHTFYSEMLGFATTAIVDSSFIVSAGFTNLTFRQSDAATPYHFAFNIPSDSIDEAAEWLGERLGERTPILSFEGKQIQEFSDWEAHAVYFYDPDRNIVEFISRHRLNAKLKGAFDSQAIMCVSEIGLPLLEIEPTYRQFADCGLEIFDGGFERFCAIGDDQGLFICINRDRKLWFPVDDPAHPSAFKAVFAQMNRKFELHFSEGKVALQSLK